MFYKTKTKTKEDQALGSLRLSMKEKRFELITNVKWRETKI